MLPLPFARMAADEHERRRLAEPLNHTRVGADQQRQSLDRRIPADVEKDGTAGPEGSELLVTVGDAPRPAALIPAARLLDQPVPPERKPLLSRKRSRPKALELDPARQAAQLRPLAAEKQCRFRLRPGRHNKQGAAPRPCSQPPAPILSVTPARRRS